MTVAKVSVSGVLVAGGRRVSAGSAATAARRGRLSGDSLRHSPLAHLLADTADAMLATPDDSPVDAVAAPGAVRDMLAQQASVSEREQALMAFARALTQALRPHPELDDEARVHARHRPWGMASRPVDQLATRRDGDDLARQHALLEAFIDLQRAWGAADRRDDGAPHERLHAFLNALAARMGGGVRGDWAEATQPGSLIDVRA